MCLKSRSLPAVTVGGYACNHRSGLGLFSPAITFPFRVIFRHEALRGRIDLRKSHGQKRGDDGGQGRERAGRASLVRMFCFADHSRKAAHRVRHITFVPEADDGLGSR